MSIDPICVGPVVQIGKALPSIKLTSGNTLLLQGPGSVRLVSGEGSILRAPLPGERLVVREDRQIPVETSTGAELEVHLGLGSKYRIVQESTIPTGWKEAAQILQQSPGTVVILGDVDSGKSTLCTFLANECYSRGIKVGIIDGDVGQADIGPPTTISAAKMNHHIFSLQGLEPQVSLFMGDTSPASISSKLSKGLIRLKESILDRLDVLLVNTDGWVQGDDAVSFKAELLDGLQPDIMLGLSSNGELNQLLDLLGSTALSLERSEHARTRTKEERRKARGFGYKRFLHDGRRMELMIGHVKIRRFDSSQQQMRLDGSLDLRGVLAGLLDEDENLLSIARLERLVGGVMALTARTNDSPRTVELGAVILSPSFEEIGFES